jgi:hypothetical protein
MDAEACRSGARWGLGLARAVEKTEARTGPIGRMLQVTFPERAVKLKVSAL